MGKNQETLSLQQQLDAESVAVNEFLAFYRSASDVAFVVYTEWTAKDVLAHIASWHMSFARNLVAAIKGEKPTPFRGSLTSINEGEVKRLSTFSTAEVIAMVEAAQGTIVEHILDPKLGTIVYRAGKRSLTPVEYLEVVTRHIRRHHKDVLRTSL